MCVYSPGENTHTQQAHTHHQSPHEYTHTRSEWRRQIKCMPWNSCQSLKWSNVPTLPSFGRRETSWLMPIQIGLLSSTMHSKTLIISIWSWSTCQVNYKLKLVVTCRWKFTFWLLWSATLAICVHVHVLLLVHDMSVGLKNCKTWVGGVFYKSASVGVVQTYNFRKPLTMIINMFPHPM